MHDGSYFLCKPTGNDNRYQIKVDFIEPWYFEEVLAVGEHFTIREGNIVLITETVVSERQ